MYYVAGSLRIDYWLHRQNMIKFLIKSESFKHDWPNWRSIIKYGRYGQIRKFYLQYCS